MIAPSLKGFQVNRNSYDVSTHIQIDDQNGKFSWQLKTQNESIHHPAIYGLITMLRKKVKNI